MRRDSVQRQFVFLTTTVVLALAFTAAFGADPSDNAPPTTAPSADAASSTPAAPAAPTTAPAADAGEGADQMMSRLLQPSANSEQPLAPLIQAPTPDSSSGAGAVAPDAPTVNTLREGTWIFDRAGRLTPTSDGQQEEFTFDADGKSMADPPVIILPNLKLMTMQDAVSSSNRDLHFRITGMLTEYRGRNYILLEKVVVVPDITRQF